MVIGKTLFPNTMQFFFCGDIVSKILQGQRYHMLIHPAENFRKLWGDWIPSRVPSWVGVPEEP